MLIIFSVSCATETVTEEVDPESRATNFTLTSPENGQLFSIAVTEIPFTFSYTREATDFSDYAFTLNVCRDEALTDCIDFLVSDISSNEDEDESDAFLPTVTNFRPIFLLGLLGLFIPFVLCYALSLRLREKKAFPLASASMLTLFALFVGGVLGGALRCTTTLTEQVTRDPSPELTGTAAIPIEISAEALGAYYWRITAARTDGTGEPQTSQQGSFFVGLESAELNRTAVTLSAGDNVGAPIRVEGATGYSLSGCSGFAIDTVTGQVSVASLPTSSAPQNCTLNVAGGANPLALDLTINHPNLFFGMVSYSFSLFNNAPADEDVGDPVTATLVGGGAITYTLNSAISSGSCPAFEINSTSGQISVAADSPAVGLRNCTVTASTTAITASAEVEIVVNNALSFDQEFYSFDVLATASADDNVGDPVTATFAGGGTVTYSLSNCTGFEINSTSGQISVMAANPAAGVRSCG